MLPEWQTKSKTNFKDYESSIYKSVAGYVNKAVKKAQPSIDRTFNPTTGQLED